VKNPNRSWGEVLVSGGNLEVAYISSRLSAFAQLLHLGLGFRHCQVSQFERGLGENPNVRVRLDAKPGFGCQRHALFGDYQLDADIRPAVAKVAGAAVMRMAVTCIGWNEPWVGSFIALPMADGPGLPVIGEPAVHEDAGVEPAVRVGNDNSPHVEAVLFPAGLAALSVVDK